MSAWAHACVVRVRASVRVRAWVGGHSLHMRSGTICLWGWEAHVSALKPSKANDQHRAGPSQDAARRGLPSRSRCQPDKRFCVGACKTAFSAHGAGFIK